MSEQAPTPSHRLSGPAVLASPLVSELLGLRVVAVLATHEPDGAVHAVPVWFAGDGDAILIGTGGGSRKVANLRRDPRASVTLHDSRPGYEVCGVCLIGAAEVVEGEAGAALVRLVHARYLAPGAGDLADVRAFMDSDDVAVRFRPERAFTWDERDSAAARALAGTNLAYGLEPTSPRGYGVRPGTVSQ